MKKKILGLRIDVDAIGWAIMIEKVSELPIFPKSEIDYEIKSNIYIVDSTGEDVVVFEIVNFESPEKREKFKVNLQKKYPSIFGADSKEETGLCYLIYSDNLFSTNERDLQERAIRAMDWFIEIIL